MSVVTVNDVRRGVMNALKQRFPTVKIYGEEIAQGFEPPAFFVKLFPVSHTREVGRRYLRAHSFDVHYFPGSKYENEEMHDVAEQLYDALEYIDATGTKYRGARMNHEIVDGVLHFFVDYDFHVMRPVPDVPKMQTLEQEGWIK